MNLWKERGYDFYKDKKLNYTFVEDFINYDAYELAKNIKVPTLIVHGDVDTTVPIEQSKKIATMISDCTLEVIKDADHKYSNDEHFDRMIDMVSQFILKHV